MAAISPISFLFSVLILLIAPIPSTAGKPHVIKFRSPNLYPEGLAYDRSAQHFIVGSLRHRSIHSVSDAGVVDTLITDLSLPPNASILGLAVDSVNNRLLAAVHSMAPLPIFNALAAYDLRTRQQLFLSLLPDGGATATAARPVANAVAVDFKGNAYVTNSLGTEEGNFIWKVDSEGNASIFSRSDKFTESPVDRDLPYSESGLNGVAYVSKGYLLVVQSNTGKVFKVDEVTGGARRVILPADLMHADGIAVRRRDGAALVVSHEKVWFLKSDDSWAEAAVFDSVELEDREGFATAVAAAAEDRAYVLYGSVMEGILGNVEVEREWFRIEEVRSAKEGEGENVILYVMIGLGLAYFLFWRFQMKQLVRNMDKKTT
ncbi:unnamed protein product [Linum tenue]|uniref:Uncharacterized protein n=1 Tax=Linum tenue TaxID=586396 RepID=A0AAV0JUM4_9ROSI|nr:unnamed protein product [Linum tenue]